MCSGLTGRVRAFTLIEMVVVLAIFVVVGAMVVPRIGRGDSSTLRAAAQQLAADLRITQSEAIAHGDAVRVLDLNLNDGRFYTLMNVTMSDGSNADASQKLQSPWTDRVYEVRFGEAPFAHLDGVWVARSNTGNHGWIRFGRYGQVLDYDVNPTIVLARGDQTLTLTVDKDLGDVTIDSAFGDLSAVSSIPMPGPSGKVREAVSPY